MQVNNSQNIKLFTIPNLITTLNLLCGTLSVVYAANYDFSIAAYLIIVGTVFDFLDGFVARLLKSYSLIGKELDSLADMISFGLAPGFLVYTFLNYNFPELNYYTYVAFLIPIFSALRLAKFNIDERQLESFVGLPTPANALFFLSFILISFSPNLFELKDFFVNPYLILPFIIINSYLLISEIPMFSFKFKSLNFRENKIRYIFITISIILLISLHFYSIPLIIFLYIGISIINNLKIKVLKK